MAKTILLPRWCWTLVFSAILFTTSCRSRDVAYDISVNDLRALTPSYTHPNHFFGLSLRAGTPPPEDDPPPPADDRPPFDKAQSRGCRLYITLTEGGEAQSFFTDRSALIDNGWVDGGQVDKPPFSAPSPAGMSEELGGDVVYVYGKLPISADIDDNPLYYWAQGAGERGKLRYTEQAYGTGTGSFETERPYGRTLGFYGNQINPTAGMITSLYNFGPRYMLAFDDARRKKGEKVADTGPAPPLQRLSDLLWYQWSDAVQTKNADIRNIKYFYQRHIASEFSKEVLKTIYTMPGQALSRWPGNVYSFTATGDELLVAQALLGSENGIAIGFFLAQHSEQLGRKTVSHVRLWGDTGYGDGLTFNPNDSESEEEDDEESLAEEGMSPYDMDTDSEGYGSQRLRKRMAARVLVANMLFYVVDL